MLDARMRIVIDPPLTRAGLWLAGLGVSENAVTGIVKSMVNRRIISSGVFIRCPFGG